MNITPVFLCGIIVTPQKQIFNVSLWQIESKSIVYPESWVYAMDYTIRALREDEYPLLREFLYEAIFIPEGVRAPSRRILDTPELRVYIEDFGQGEHDIALAAEMEGKIIGAVWVRVMKDYGHVDDQTPSFAISLVKEYRGRGIGTEMMRKMLKILKERGYEQASLAVQKANYAVSMYYRVGFEVVDENEEEYIMVKRLVERTNMDLSK